MAASQNSQNHPTMPEVEIIKLYCLTYHLSFPLICFLYHNLFFFALLALGGG